MIPKVVSSWDEQRPPFWWRGWLRLTAPAGADRYASADTHRAREYLRHAQLNSWAAPLVFFAPLLLLQQAQSGGEGTLIAIMVLMASSVFALLCNRLGYQVVAALVLVLVMDIVIEGALLTAPGGLSSGWLLTFDLFVIPLIATGILLGRRFLWGSMLLHIGCIVGDVFFLPHAPDLVALINMWHGPTIAFAHPLIIQLVGGMLSFIEVRSTDQAIERADQAQIIERLHQALAREQQRLMQEHQQLEAGVAEVVAVLAQAANGQFIRRTTLPKDSALWHIGVSLNTLFARMEHLKQAERMVQQIEQEVVQIREELHRGIVPLPSGGLLDPLLKDVRAAVGLEAPSSAPLPPLSPTSWETPVADAFPSAPRFPRWSGSNERDW